MFHQRIRSALAIVVSVTVIANQSLAGWNMGILRAANRIGARRTAPVPPPNTPPTISTIVNRVIPKNAAATATFQVADAETPVGELKVAAISDNPNFMPNDRLSLTGEGADRTLTATPVGDLEGTATITVTVSDAGGLRATTPMTLSAKKDLPYVPGEILVTYRKDAFPDPTAMSSFTRSPSVPVGAGSLGRSPRVPEGGEELAAKSLEVLQRTSVLKFAPHEDVQNVEETYKRIQNVEEAGKNQVYGIQAVNDPHFTKRGSWGQPYFDLWGLHKIQAQEAWKKSRGEGVVVAVIDTGINLTHPDLAANIWINTEEIPGNNIDDDKNGYVDDVNGWNFVQNNNDPSDGHSHGTHVSGTIAAVGDNGLGVVGISYKAKIMPLKGLADSGSGNLVDLAKAIRYAADNGADVINMSWGGEFPCTGFNILAYAVNYAYGKGVTLVASAGNGDVNVIRHSPAGCPNVISVAATGPTDERMNMAGVGISNWGSKLDVAAPGVDILSTQNGDYGSMSGTSMASPHVAGLAALILSSYPAYTNDQVRRLIRSSADDIGNPGFDQYFGFGRINAARALGVAPFAASVWNGKINVGGDWYSSSLYKIQSQRGIRPSGVDKTLALVLWAPHPTGGAIVEITGGRDGSVGESFGTEGPQHIIVDNKTQLEAGSNIILVEYRGSANPGGNLPSLFNPPLPKYGDVIPGYDTFASSEFGRGDEEDAIAVAQWVKDGGAGAVDMNKFFVIGTRHGGDLALAVAHRVPGIARVIAHHAGVDGKGWLNWLSHPPANDYPDSPGNSPLSVLTSLFGTPSDREAMLHRIRTQAGGETEWNNASPGRKLYDHPPLSSNILLMSNVDDPVHPSFLQTDYVERWSPLFPNIKLFQFHSRESPPSALVAELLLQFSWEESTAADYLLNGSLLPAEFDGAVQATVKAKFINASTGLPLPGVKVTFYENFTTALSSPVQTSGISDAEGIVSIMGPRAGFVSFSAEAAGFTPIVGPLYLNRGVTDLTSSPIGLVLATPQVPLGNLENVDMTGLVTGWALDKNTPSQSISVYFYVDGSTFAGDISADKPRPDVNLSIGVPGHHGFSWRIPEQFQDGKPHQLYAYALNKGAGDIPLLPGSPMPFRVLALPHVKHFGWVVANEANVSEVSVQSGVDLVVVGGSRTESNLASISAAGKKGIVSIGNVLFTEEKVAPDPARTFPTNPDMKLATDYEARWNRFVQDNHLKKHENEIGAFYLADEPYWNNLTYEEIRKAGWLVKRDFPSTPISIVEAYPVLQHRNGSDLRVPEVVDWIGFDNYGIRHPASDPQYLADFATLKSTLTRPKQRILFIGDAWWHASFHGANGVTPEDMGELYIEQATFASKEPLVTAIVNFIWDPAAPDWIGAKGLPPFAQSVYSAIGTSVMSNPPGDTIAPLVAITSPINGADIDDDSVVTAEVSATDDTAVSGVEYYVDGHYVGESTAAPFQLSQSAKLYSMGTHQLGAIAYDAQGNASLSEVRSFTVSHAPVNGKVTVTSIPPGARIYTSIKDGPLADSGRATPATLEGVSSGKVFVKLVLSGYEDWTGTKTLAGGATVQFDARLTQNAGVDVPAPEKVGTIQVRATDSSGYTGAEVWLSYNDGEETYSGQTVNTLIPDLPAGKYRVRLVKTGKAPWMETKDLLPGEDLTFDAPAGATERVPKPTGLQVGSVTPTTIGLSWDDLATAENWINYLAEVSRDPQFLDPSQKVGSTLVSMVEPQNHPPLIRYLLPDTIYHIRLVGFASGKGDSEYSDVVSATTSAGPKLVIPGVPLFQGVPFTSKQMKVIVQPAADAKPSFRYLLEYSSDGFRTTKSESLIVSEAVLKDLQPHTTYSVRLYAYDVADPGLRSDWSPTGQFTTGDPDETEAPSVPVPILSAVSSTKLRMSWDPSIDTGVGVAGYVVSLTSDADKSVFVSGFKDIDVGNATSQTVERLSPTIKYYAWVKSYDYLGNYSVDSAPATGFTMPDTEKPTAPSDVQSLMVREDSISIDWFKSEDNVDVAEYLVDVATDKEFLSYVPGFKDLSVMPNTLLPRTLQSIAGLRPNMIYFFRVRARDSAGNLSDFSSIAQASTLDTEKPTAPGTPVLSGSPESPSQLNVTWPAATDNGKVVGYFLDVSEDVGFTAFVPGYHNLDVENVTSRTITGLRPGGMYYVRLRARDEANNTSDNSEVVYAVTFADREAPTSPVVLTFSAVTSSDLSLTWGASTDNAEVTGYTLDVSEDEEFSSFVEGYLDKDVGNGTSASLGGLSPSTTYFARIRAHDASGNTSGPSLTISATTLGDGTADTEPPTAPGSPNVVPDDSLRAMKLTWSPSLDNVKVTDYLMDLSIDPTFSIPADPDHGEYRNFSAGEWGLTHNEWNVVIVPFRPGTTYFLRLRARDAGGNVSGDSQIVSATTPVEWDTVNPTPPTNLSLYAVSSTELELTWTAGTDNGGVKGYILALYRDAGLTTPVPGYANKKLLNVTERRITGLTPSTTYYAKLYTYDMNFLWSPPSEIAIGSTLP